MYTEKELNELEQFFKSTTLPKEIQLTRDQRVSDVKKFIDSHLQVCRGNLNNKAFQSFYDRLVKLKDLLQNQ